MREVAEPFTVHGHVFPPGRTLGISSQLSMRDPTVFPNPDEFNPSRFLAETCGSKEALKHFSGFGKSAHVCLGQSLATMEIRLVIFQILQNFKLVGIRSSLGKDVLPSIQWASLGLGMPEHPVHITWKRL